MTHPPVLVLASRHRPVPPNGREIPCLSHDLAMIRAIQAPISSRYEWGRAALSSTRAVVFHDCGAFRLRWGGLAGRSSAIARVRTGSGECTHST